MISRYLNIEQELRPAKTLLLVGPRRVGKTTLLKEFVSRRAAEIIEFNGDDLSTQQIFSVPDSRRLMSYIGEASILAIDEAQAVPNIGSTLKLINDSMPEVSIIVTGSSSFELTGQIGEPLTGRKTTRYLFPVSVEELYTDSKRPQLDFENQLAQLLVYGMYPNAITATDDVDRAEFLRELVDSYLLRDILTFKEIKGSRTMLQLLVLLAHQVGNEVSLNELGTSLGIDKATVGRYLDMLEKSYIIFRLGGFSRNLRNEVTKKAKYYFYDVGVRNAIINNFNVLDLRNDVGQLWENFVISERLKVRTYAKLYANQYFWRTWNQQKIDLVEERDGKLFAYEFKWSTKSTPATPTEWSRAYGDNSEWLVVNPSNALEFLAGSR